MVLFSHLGRFVAYMEKGHACLCRLEPQSGDVVVSPDYRFPAENCTMLAVSDSGLVALLREPETIIVTNAFGEEVRQFSWEILGQFRWGDVFAEFVPYPIVEFCPSCRIEQIGDEFLFLGHDVRLHALLPPWIAYDDSYEAYTFNLVTGEKKRIPVIAPMQLVNQGIVLGIRKDVLWLPQVEEIGWGDIGVGIVLFSLPYNIGRIAIKDGMLSVWCKNGAVYVADIANLPEGISVAEVARGVFDVVWCEDGLALQLNRRPPLAFSFRKREELGNLLLAGARESL